MLSISLNIKIYKVVKYAEIYYLLFESMDNNEQAIKRLTLQPENSESAITQSEAQAQIQKYLEEANTQDSHLQLHGLKGIRDILEHSSPVITFDSALQLRFQIVTTHAKHNPLSQIQTESFRILALIIFSIEKSTKAAPFISKIYGHIFSENSQLIDFYLIKEIAALTQSSKKYRTLLAKTELPKLMISSFAKMKGQQYREQCIIVLLNLIQSNQNEKKWKKAICESIYNNTIASESLIIRCLIMLIDEIEQNPYFIYEHVSHVQQLWKTLISYVEIEQITQISLTFLRLLCEGYPSKLKNLQLLQTEFLPAVERKIISSTIQIRLDCFKILVALCRQQDIAILILKRSQLLDNIFWLLDNDHRDIKTISFKFISAVIIYSPHSSYFVLQRYERCIFVNSIQFFESSYQQLFRDIFRNIQMVLEAILDMKKVMGSQHLRASLISFEELGGVKAMSKMRQLYRSRQLRAWLRQHFDWSIRKQTVAILNDFEPDYTSSSSDEEQ